jgi:hypothetical protein
MKDVIKSMPLTVQRAFAEIERRFPMSKAARHACIELAQRRPKTSEAGLIAAAELAEKFERANQITAIASECGQPSGNALFDFIDRRVSLDEVRRFYSQQAAVAGWAKKLTEAHTRH